MELMPNPNKILNTIDLLTYLKPYIDEHYDKVIMHFPHSSLKVPKWGESDLLINKYEDLDAHKFKLTDLFLPILFKTWPYKKIIAKYSRLFVDVEKYWDDDKEEFAKYGLGAVYAKYHKRDPKFMIKAKKYYDDYHRKLSKACMCKDNEKCLILDIHSYSDIQASEFTQCVERFGMFPGVCIGFNKENKDKELLKKLRYYFETRGIIYAENYPYKGTIIPNNINTKNITSVMLEFNKRLYL